MITTLQVTNIENAETKAGVEYWRLETSEGKMSCWDAELIEDIRTHLGKSINAEYTLSKDGKYKTIRSFDTIDVGPVKVVAVAQVEQPKESQSEKNKNAGVATRYAVDLCIAGKIEKGDIGSCAQGLMEGMKLMAH